MSLTIEDMDKELKIKEKMNILLLLCCVFLSVGTLLSILDYNGYEYVIIPFYFMSIMFLNMLLFYCLVFIIFIVNLKIYEDSIKRYHKK